ncbi:hypothetical protein HMPREF9248_0956 [Fannyhessea vaginae PB189-T1-4]|uniref:Uncharacterized protein n=2 Tax=Fannyhessea vaginae TaxID=82135 RepID=A0ABP2IYM4_9ACTN|nr:hypothetical protein HMPREF9248_0956 [Fannyhessea vaginae PB189-T1-4]
MPALPCEFYAGAHEITQEMSGMSSPTHAYEHFSDITHRLDEIASTVKSKDISLEATLDLFDEAIALGARAVTLVDVPKDLDDAAVDASTSDDAEKTAPDADAADAADTADTHASSASSSSSLSTSSSSSMEVQ